MNWLLADLAQSDGRRASKDSLGEPRYSIYPQGNLRNRLDRRNSGVSMIGGCALEIELGQNDSLVEIVASESIKEVPWELKTSVLNILRLWV